MDCLTAQQLISDALDDVAVAADELARAKTHCRDCKECSVFVRSMLATQRAGLPAVPEDLPERIMVVVRSDADRLAAASAKKAAAVTNPAGPSHLSNGTVAPVPTAVPPVQPAKSWTELFERAWHPRNRRRFVAWSAAAAVLFIAAAIGALSGVRAILVPQRLDTRTMTGSASESALAPDEEVGTSDDLAADSAAPPAAGQTSGPSFMTLDGWVYRLSGPSQGVDESTLSRKGSTRSSLSADGTPRTQRVLGTTSATPVYIEADGGELLGFDLVTRSYGGKSYGLQSRPIAAFGEWPTLPQGMRQPTSTDGSPTFTEDGTDDRGTTVFRLRSASAADGIAIAPNPPVGDPLAGAPNWSWWAPQP